MPIPTGNGENPQFYGQWTVQDSQNGLCTKSIPRQRIPSAWIPDTSSTERVFLATFYSFDFTSLFSALRSSILESSALSTRTLVLLSVAETAQKEENVWLDVVCVWDVWGRLYVHRGVYRDMFSYAKFFWWVFPLLVQLQKLHLHRLLHIWGLPKMVANSWIQLALCGTPRQHSIHWSSRIWLVVSCLFSGSTGLGLLEIWNIHRFGYVQHLKVAGNPEFSRSTNLSTWGEKLPDFQLELYTPWMRFIDLNWDINNHHKYPRRINEIHSPVLFRFESIKGLGLGF